MSTFNHQKSTTPAAELQSTPARRSTVSVGRPIYRTQSASAIALCDGGSPARMTLRKVYGATFGFVSLSTKLETSKRLLKEALGKSIRITVHRH